MKQLLLISAMFLFYLISGKAQLGNIIFGGDGEDCIYEMEPAPDSNYYTIGTKGGTLSRIWLMKISPQGEMIWEKTYAPTNDEFPEVGLSVNVFPDGSLVMTGYQLSDDPFDDRMAIVLKADADGNLIWKRRYDNVSELNDAVQVLTGIMLCGSTIPGGSSVDGIIVLTAPNGQITSTVTVEISNQTFIKKIIPVSADEFLLVGRANVIGAGYEGIFLRKVTKTGGEIWTTTHDTGFREQFGNNGEDTYPIPLGVFRKSNGDVWVTNPYGFIADISVMRFSPEGVLEDEKIYGTPAMWEYPCAITLLEDNALLVTGSTNNRSSFAFRIKESGIEDWHRYYGQNNSNLICYDAVSTDERFLLCGRFQDDVMGLSDFDGWILAVQKNGYPNMFSIRGKTIYDENNNCLFDPGEIPLPGWFVDITSEIGTDTFKSLRITDENGFFEIKIDSSINILTLFNRDTSKWRVCNNPVSIQMDQSNPADSIVFLVQTKVNCAYPEISLTQPDLIRCETSCLTATIQNDGPISSVPHLLTIKMDEALALVHASAPYTIVGKEITFDIDPIQRFEYTNIEMCVALDCNVQLGATHTISASIESLVCQPDYMGPKFDISGTCDGDAVKVFFQNIGGGGDVQTTYDVLADGILIMKQVDIHLPEGGELKEIELPADGRTWHVELAPPADLPFQEFPSVTIEGCGKRSNGLHSIGFGNAWRLNDLEPDKCILQIPNSLGIPNKISEATQGLGYYNLITDTLSLEFSARVENPFDFTATEVVIELTFNDNLDPRTFQLLSAPDRAIFSLVDTNRIRLGFNDVFIDSSQSVMIRFRIQPRENVQPDSGSSSLFVVSAIAYFDETGPIDLYPGYNNYSLTVPIQEDPYNNYSSEFKLFGGRRFEFGINMAKAKHGGVFLSGETSSFSQNDDGFVVKVNSLGRAEWFTAIDSELKGPNSIRGIAGLPDGGCLVSGNYSAPNTDNYLSDYNVFITRLDEAGRVLWTKYLDNPIADKGSWAYGMLECPDDQYIIFGTAQNDGADQFYLKVDMDGNLVWSLYNNINGSNFEPSKGFVLKDGSFVFLGTNESTMINVDVFVEKLDNEGNLVWNTPYQSLDYIYLGDIAEGLNGDLMVTGYSQWAVNDTHYVITPTFINIDPEGHVLWEKSPLTGPRDIAEPSCITNLPDGGFLVGGNIYIDTSEHSMDMMLLKINSDAEVQWYRNYGVKNYESVDDILIYSEDEIFIWGNNQPRLPFYDLQAILVKTDGEGYLTLKEPDLAEVIEPVSYVFPNPADREAIVVLSPENQDPLQWVLMDLTGRIMIRGVHPTYSALRIETGLLPSGLYFIAFPGTTYPGKKIIVAH